MNPLNQSEIVATIRPVIEAFDKLGIAYSIGGSVASSSYGIARATMDVDIVADIRTVHASRLVEWLSMIYYIDEDMILNAISRQSSFNLIHLETMIKVDVFILKNEPYHQTAHQRRRQDTLEDSPDTPQFYFVSAEDIVLSKLDWYRLTGETSERQWGDVLGVLKVQDALLDQAYLEHWASVLRLSPLLHKALSDAGL